MKGPAIFRCGAAAALLTLSLAASAFADEPDGSGWTYNPGTGEIGLRVSNNTSAGRTVTGVDFDLGSGTVNSASSSGASCTHTVHDGSCTFGSPLAQSRHASVFIGTPGPKPASVAVTLHKSDASSQSIPAAECPETQFPAQASLPDATATQPYSNQLPGQGGANPHYFAYGSGELPPVGLSLFGLLSGTPPASSARTDPYVFFVNVYDGAGCPSFPKYSLKVNDAGGPGAGCTPQISSHKLVDNPQSVFRDELVDLEENVVKQRDREYAAPEGAPIAYAISISNGAECPGRVTVTDLLPAGFKVDRADLATDLGTGNSDVTLADRPPDSRSEEGGRTRVTFTVDVPAATRVVGGLLDGQVIPGSVTIYIVGIADVGDEVNQAQVGSVQTNSVTVHVTPEPEVSGLNATGDQVDGDASDGSTGRPRVQAGAARSPLWRLRRVQVAIQALTPKRLTKGCVWIRDRAGHVKRTAKVLGSCRPTVWLNARGTRHWVLKLKRRLPRGRYRIDARAVNRAGVTNNRFSRARRNQVRLTVG